MTDETTTITQIVSSPDGDFFTTVILSQEMFDEICDELERIRPLNLVSRLPVAPSFLAKVRRMKCLPMIQRSARTQILFDRFNVITDRMCGMVKEFAAEAYE